jgi:UDP-3-O-[3-hydroxymyristoyl] glucosamine N-acyltransferase
MRFKLDRSGVGRWRCVRQMLNDSVFAGPNSTIQAISISSHVHIGHHCNVGPFAIIKENVKILPHTVVPANMVIASGSVVDWVLEVEARRSGLKGAI